jgi:two-component system response regulator NreC
MPRIKVLLADDHKIVRQGLRALLNAQADLAVVGEASDGREAVELAASLKPDVVLMDLMMPNLSGLEATHQIRTHDVQVVILSMHANTAHAIQALRNGAIGYVLKDSDAQEVINAVRAAAERQRYLDPAIANPVMEALIHNEAADGDPYQVLTEREREILQLVAEGHTNAAIAQKLSISLRTVETHRANLMRKLDIHSPADLVRYAIRHGFSKLEP